MALVMIGMRGNLSIAVEAKADDHIFLLILRDIAAGMELRLALTHAETARLAVEAGRAVKVHTAAPGESAINRWVTRTEV